MANTIVGVYDDYQQAQQVVQELKQSGFEIENVRLSPEEQSQDARYSALSDSSDQEKHGSSGVMGFFRSLFGSDEDEDRHADVYSEAVRRGSYLVTVHAQSDEQSELATEIMNRFDPINIDERSTAWRSQGWSGYDPSSSALSDDEISQERSRYAGSALDTDINVSSRDASNRNTSSRNVQDERQIPVIQEELQLGKRAIQRGGVRIFQRVTEQPVEESIQLREEHVSVKRQPANRPASQADIDSLQDTQFELRETAEEPIVAKSARVVEQVVVGKEVSERTERVKDTVRRSDVEVENLGSEAQTQRSYAGRGLGEDEFRTHWQSTYGQSSRFEDYAPAYQYGSQIASDDRYREQQWSDVEDDVQHDWEASHSDRPWERVKDAVRYGWEKVTR
ncbi:MAG: hypothetical protein K0S28_1373 [Paucimonas sp.]|jgi:uncharacterized protein (TIGR02271 family)|nr:hypothetical protein [Paucimonas sp.]